MYFMTSSFQTSCQELLIQFSFYSVVNSVYQVHDDMYIYSACHHCIIQGGK